MTEEHKIITRRENGIYYVESGEEKYFGETLKPLYIKKTKHFEYEQLHCEVTHKNVKLENWDFRFCPFCGAKVKE